MNQFKDKVVIVTGGAQGIGKCIADEFRKEGANVDDRDERVWKVFTKDLYGKVFADRGYIK